MSVLLDAGPVLNFLAVNQEGILLKTASSHHLALHVPERVAAEVHGKSQSARFAATSAYVTWKKLRTHGHVTVLPDDLGRSSFNDAVARVAKMPATDRVRSTKSLGEIMVIAHASVLVQHGHDVFMLIDDGEGRTLAKGEQEWLLRAGAPGRLGLWHTNQVLKQADPTWFTGGLTWRQVYDRMRKYDDGLPPL